MLRERDVSNPHLQHRADVVESNRKRQVTPRAVLEKTRCGDGVRGKQPRRLAANSPSVKVRPRHWRSPDRSLAVHFRAVRGNQLRVARAQKFTGDGEATETTNLRNSR